jgi:hypothetical protein
MSVIRTCLAAAACLALMLTALVLPTSPATAAQTGYDAYACNLPTTGMAVRDRASDGGLERGRVHNGDPLHVYATENSEPNIPAGWALGYGRPGGGDAVNGYFKLAYTCPPAK